MLSTQGPTAPLAIQQGDFVPRDHFAQRVLFPVSCVAFRGWAMTYRAPLASLFLCGLFDSGSRGPSSLSSGLRHRNALTEKVWEDAIQRQGKVRSI